MAAKLDKKRKEYNANTHAEFIEKAYHVEVKHLRHAVWTKPDGTDVWMVRMDGLVRDDWRNTRRDNDNIIVEEYVGKDSIQLKKNESVCPIRVAVCILDYHCGTGRIYTILGTYELDLNESDIKRCRVWRKVSDDK